MVRVGRVWLELRIDQSPVTRDVAAATRDLALALVSQAMAAMGADRTPKVRVVEGRDQGAALALDRGRTQRTSSVARRTAICRSPTPDASREHAARDRPRRRGLSAIRGSKNGTFVGDAACPTTATCCGGPAIMVRIGRTVLALEEPVGHALADLERAADEQPCPPEEIATAPPAAPRVGGPRLPRRARCSSPRRRTRPPPIARHRPRGAPAEAAELAGRLPTCW